jgi:hypothetical protein
MRKLIILSLAVLAFSMACLLDYPLSLLLDQIDSTDEASVEATDEGYIPDTIECSDDTCVTSCIDRAAEILQPGGTWSVDMYTDLDQSYDLVAYEVSDGELGDATSYDVPDDLLDIQEDQDTQIRIWDYAASILPPSEMHWLNQYLAFTDGTDNDLAYVYNDEEIGRSKWMLAVDEVDASDTELLTETLVHEFFHLISLNSDQVPEDSSDYNWEQGEGGCDTFRYYYGCTNEDSYLNQFYEAFWVDIFPDWKEIVGDPSADLEAYDEDAVAQFYEMYSDQFVDDYAPTEIGEDMAETFEKFVLEPMPAGDTIPEQKILFFYQFPELVEMRSEMIQGICGYRG